MLVTGRSTFKRIIANLLRLEWYVDRQLFSCVVVWTPQIHEQWCIHVFINSSLPPQTYAHNWSCPSPKENEGKKKRKKQSRIQFPLHALKSRCKCCVLDFALDPYVLNLVAPSVSCNQTTAERHFLAKENSIIAFLWIVQLNSPHGTIYSTRGVVTSGSSFGWNLRTGPAPL